MRRLARLLICVALLPTLVAAENVQTRFQVSAQVVPRASIEPVGIAPQAIRVTALDLSRGYKDIAASYRIRSNDARGYLLRFATRAGLTDGIEVRGLASPFVIGELGAEMMQSAAAPVQDYDLQFRLHLSPTAQAGTYELPVLVAVATL
jgi:hypothetical protein